MLTICFVAFFSELEIFSTAYGYFGFKTLSARKADRIVAPANR